MTADVEILQTIKAQTLQLIVEITTQPKPTYYVDGQSVSWENYLERLQRTVDWCDAKSQSDDPFELASRAET